MFLWCICEYFKDFESVLLSQVKWSISKHVILKMHISNKAGGSVITTISLGLNEKINVSVWVPFTLSPHENRSLIYEPRFEWGWNYWHHDTYRASDCDLRSLSCLLLDLYQGQLSRAMLYPQFRTRPHALYIKTFFVTCAVITLREALI